MTCRRFFQKGFTLLEMMVSLLIIGILLGMATLSIGNDGQRRNTQEEMSRLRHKILLAARESVINHQEIGLRFFSDGYQFFMMNEKNQWVSIEDDRFFRARTLPATSKLFLQVEGQRVALSSSSPSSSSFSSSSPGLPQLFFLSSGEQTPFQVKLRASGKDVFRLSGDLSGSLQLSEINVLKKGASQDDEL